MGDCCQPTTSTTAKTSTTTKTTTSGDTSTTQTNSTISSTATSLPVPQRIIDTILADINAVMPNYQILVSSYRLLVGAAEEISRTPGAPKEIFERAVLRMDNSGTLIDIFLDLLLCKISFSSDFLSVTCAPVDLFRLLATNNPNCDTPHRTGEQILQLELIRRTLEKYRDSAKPSVIPPQFDHNNSIKTNQTTAPSPHITQQNDTPARPPTAKQQKAKGPTRWTFPVKKSSTATAKTKATEDDSKKNK